MNRLRRLAANYPDLAAFAVGLALLSAGCFWAWPPAGLIAPGAVLIAVALFGDKRA